MAYLSVSEVRMYVRTTQLVKKLKFFPGSTAEIQQHHLTGGKTVTVQHERTFSISEASSQQKLAFPFSVCLCI